MLIRNYLVVLSMTVAFLAATFGYYSFGPNGQLVYPIVNLTAIIALVVLPTMIIVMIGLLRLKVDTEFRWLINGWWLFGAIYSTLALSNPEGLLDFGHTLIMSIATMGIIVIVHQHKNKHQRRAV